MSLALSTIRFGILASITSLSFFACESRGPGSTSNGDGDVNGPFSGGSSQGDGDGDGSSGGPLVVDGFDDVPEEVGGPTGGDIPAAPWPAPPAGAAVAVSVGQGSFASHVPDGVNASADAQETAGRQLFVVDESRPIPTNDWWTTLVTETYSGNLPVYPLWVATHNQGATLETQTRWQDGEGSSREALHEGQLTIGGADFAPVDARALDWSDWDLAIRMAESESEVMDITVAHGVPYAWFEFRGVSPLIEGGTGVFDASGPVTLPFTGEALGMTAGGVNYGIFAPPGSTFSAVGGAVSVTFSGDAHYLSVATLPDATSLATFGEHAHAIVRSTRVDWEYQPGGARVITNWTLETEDLKGDGQQGTIQCFIPHHYKKTQMAFQMNGIEYFSPRGTMKCATGRAFPIAWPLRGLPTKLPAPEPIPGVDHPYLPDRMADLIEAYANRDAYGSDTYWGGKDVINYAKYMTFALETGDTASFETLRGTLREALEDWFTYTPGEAERFFALYPRWGALIGFSPSYWSEDFTDHHFHLGHFTYAAGYLALVDQTFADEYGEMATLIAKQYANYNRDDTRFPLFRTFDPWMGHSYAAGLGEGGGNNQESSSEAMQSWIGMVVLGTATNNKALRDAGAFGYAVEAQAIAEYWFDRDGENLPENWPHSISTPVHSNAVGYWTYFSGDPIWMHAINWIPLGAAFYYLVEDYDYAEAEFWGVLAETNNTQIPDSWGVELGNVALGYYQLFDPDGAAAEFDRLYDAGSPIVHDVGTAGVSYYHTHSNRRLGRVNWDAHTNLATSMVYLHPETGEKSVVAHNPRPDAITVKIFEQMQEVGSLEVPGGALVLHKY